jgi:hypothetical protein
MHRWFVFMLLAGVVACTEISFKEPQPEGVKSLSAIPAKLHGTYQIEKNGTPSGKMVVEANGYRIEKDEYDQAPEVFLLSDSVVIKNYKGYYFINVRNNSLWVLRVVRRQKDGNLLMLELPQLSANDARRNEQLQALRAIAPITETELNNTQVYIMEPRRRQLLQLLRKGYFKEQTLLRKL